jgi:outer membrane murein-binding lipoprotein Lpp
MRSRILLGVLLISMILVLAGCSSARLRENADKLDRGANQVRQVAERVEQGTVDHADLIEALRVYVPESLADEAARVLEVAEDAPGAARDVAALMEDLADDWRTQADRDADAWENTLVGGIGVAEALLGGSTVLTGLLAGVFRRKQKSAESVTEDIVTSIQSSPAIRAAIDGDGGNDLRKSMSVKTQKAVKKIKQTT